MTDKKEFNELSTEEMKELKIEFVPGCFDTFDGTQEELDALVEQIKEMFASGEALKNALRISVEDLDEADLEMIDQLSNGRTLQ